MIFFQLVYQCELPEYANSLTVCGYIALIKNLESGNFYVQTIIFQEFR